MIGKNPYYIDKEDSKKLSQLQRYNAKVNNNFLTSLFVNLYMNNGNNATLAVPPGRINQLLAGNLPYSDAETGINSNELGKKVCFLLGELEANPSSREIFQRSYFSEVIGFLCKGSISDKITASDRWENFHPTFACDPTIAKKGPFTAATLFYRDDTSLPVGINFSKLIDLIVAKDSKGNFVINKFNAFKNQATTTSIKEAVGQQLTDFRKTPQFQKNFTNSGPVAERADEAAL